MTETQIASIMALAREAGNVDRRCCIGKASGYDVRDAYAALEAALRAIEPASAPAPEDNRNEV